MSFAKIEESVQGFHASKCQEEGDHAAMAAFTSPSRNYLTDVFVYFCKVMAPQWKQEMMEVKCDQISCDHTFWIRY